MRLCDHLGEPVAPRAGQMSFVESISVLDCQPEQVGNSETIVFFNDHDRFDWRRPEAALCDVRTGVICSPNNYVYADAGQLSEGFVRITCIADYDGWNDLKPEDYSRAKWLWYDRTLESSVRFVPDFRYRVVASDVFTPTTIRRFTFHDNGAVYGAPEKRLDGSTPIDNLFLCGTDQGYVGIIGAIMSGISMANLHCLRT
jgi:phytoene dehydrogenase-like protein